jgi:hypothetical protein
MKLVSYRMTFERPDVGFAYFGSWHQEDIASALRAAQEHWRIQPQAKIDLQYSNGSGSAPKSMPLTPESCRAILQLDHQAQKNFMRIHRIQLNAQAHKHSALAL